MEKRGKPLKGLKRIEAFDFKPGELLAGKYIVTGILGSGWEGEVYSIRERGTKIERTAKVYFPQRNKGNRASRQYATRLHRLRACPVVIQYHTSEEIVFQDTTITVLISEYVKGRILSEFVKMQPAKRITPFEGLHLLHALAVGIESVHKLKEYHGDLHTGNIIVRRFGLGFDLKILDLFDWGPASRNNYALDICDIVKIFYDAVGGRRYYKGLPAGVRDIVCGLKRTQILKKFPTAERLRHHIELMSWNS